MSCRGGRASGSDQPQVRRHSGLNLEGRSHGVGRKLVISHGALDRQQDCRSCFCLAFRKIHAYQTQTWGHLGGDP
jgi:hypothetical protein